MGWIGATIDAVHDSRMARKEEKQMEREIARQYEFAQNTIQWKVEDAKAAGVHPLFALGAQTQSPTPINTSRGRGTNFARNVPDPGRQKGANAIQNAQIESLQASAGKDEAIAGYYNSLEAKGLQEQNAGQDVAETGSVEIVPRKITSRDPNSPSFTASIEPAWRKVEIGGGAYILAPASDEGWAEGLEGLLPATIAILANIGHFTGRGLQWAIANYETLKHSAQFALFKRELKRYFSPQFGPRGGWDQIDIPSKHKYRAPSRGIGDPQHKGVR